jgi:hypothetical protein
MKISYLAITILLLLGVTAQAQQKFYIAFYAKGKSVMPPSAGHAFVAFMEEDDNIKQTVIKEAWGLYPESTIAGIKSIFGKVEGVILSDIETLHEDGYVTEVSSADYYEALDIKNHWAAKSSYQLINEDCVEFIVEVAKAVDGIIVPNEKVVSRSLSPVNQFSFPLGYVKYLKFLNTTNTINYTEIIPEVYKEVCDYNEIQLDSKEKTEKTQELYKQLLGALLELGAYRMEFIEYGNFINLFPTAYFHTTAKELIKIKDNSYDFPIEKMQQMIAFFEAYKINRDNWNNNSLQVEDHWNDHFNESNYTATDYPIITGDLLLKLSYFTSNSLSTGIDAHVDIDLSRAIRFAYNEREDLSLTPLELWPDFQKTNNIFSNTQSATITDIAVAYNLSVYDNLISIGAQMFGPDVIEKRTKAWEDAFTSIPLKTHPNLSKYRWSVLSDKGGEYCPEEVAFPTLFLFDLSGSMAQAGASGAAKIEEAKASAKQTLQTIQSNNNQGVAQEVGMLSFSGSCRNDPTSPAGDINFTSNIGQATTAVEQIGSPGGGTPLAEAIKAAKQKLEAHLQASGVQSGKLIVLSDGEATCDPIRPADVYALGQQGQMSQIVNAAQQAGLLASGVKYYTVGFNIPPGSAAERDLQFLSQVSGGKYFNAQNQAQLTRAFKKFNRIYIPKPMPALTSIDESARQLFENGVREIKTEQYEEALENYKSYALQATGDCHGAYNLALMFEANEFYRSAIKEYERYLALCPGPTDEEQVKKRISELNTEYQQYLEFNRKVVASDLQYLDLHFKKIQNGESVALAQEFKGFLEEKWYYYENLPAILEIESKIFKINAKEVFRGLKSCAETIKRNPKNWDRDATPALSRTYLNMERLLKSF